MKLVLAPSGSLMNGPSRKSPKELALCKGACAPPVGGGAANSGRSPPAAASRQLGARKRPGSALAAGGALAARWGASYIFTRNKYGTYKKIRSEGPITKKSSTRSYIC